MSVGIPNGFGSIVITCREGLWRVFGAEHQRFSFAGMASVASLREREGLGVDLGEGVSRGRII